MNARRARARQGTASRTRRTARTTIPPPSRAWCGGPASPRAQRFAVARCCQMSHIDDRDLRQQRRDPQQAEPPSLLVGDPDGASTPRLGDLDYQAAVAEPDREPEGHQHRERPGGHRRGPGAPGRGLPAPSTGRSCARSPRGAPDPAQELGLVDRLDLRATRPSRASCPGSRPAARTTVFFDTLEDTRAPASSAICVATSRERPGASPSIDDRLPVEGRRARGLRGPLLHRIGQPNARRPELLDQRAVLVLVEPGPDARGDLRTRSPARRRSRPRRPPRSRRSSRTRARAPARRARRRGGC